MSDDAALWKLAFGVLILAICGLTVALRKPQAAAPAPGAVIAQPVAPAAIPAPPPPAVQHETAPPRIEIVQDEAPVTPPAPKNRPLRAPQRVQHIATVASHPQVAVRRRASLHIQRVASAQPHYPFDPRERWNPRF